MGQSKIRSHPIWIELGHIYYRYTTYVVFNICAEKKRICLLQGLVLALSSESDRIEEVQSA